MAEAKTSGSKAGAGLKRGITILALILASVLVISLVASIRGQVEESAAETAMVESRSGMYRMYDTTDESPEGAPNREKFVEISFTADGMSFEYPVVLEGGQEVKVTVSGRATEGGRTYILRHQRSDQDEPSSARWQCTFEERAGSCLVPNIEGGTNRVEFTKQ